MPEYDKQQLEGLIVDLRDFRKRHQARKQLLEAGQAVAPLLLEALADQQQPANLRWAAITILGELQYKPATDLLLEILKTENNLRGEAARALASITGEDVGQDEDAWERILRGEPAPATDSESEPEIDYVELSREAFTGSASEFSWEDPPGYAYARFDFANGRKQQVLVTFDHHDKERRPLACIYTECGAVTETARNSLEQRNNLLRYGKFLVENAEDAEKIVLRHYVRAADLSPATLLEMAVDIAGAADEFEAEISPHDQI